MGSACPWRGNARPTRLSPSVAASGPPVGPRGRSGPSWPVSVSVTTRGNHPSHPTVVLPLPLRPTAVTPFGCKLGGASRPPCRRPTASGTIRLCFKRLSAAASTWWRAGSGEWAKRAPAPAHYRCPFGCSTTTWPGGAAWCRAALGRGLVVVWLYGRPGLAFPYPLRVHPVRCLPAAWLHSSVATSKPLLVQL